MSIKQPLSTKQLMVILRKAIKASGKFVFSSNVTLLQSIQANSKYKLQINRAGTGGTVSMA